MPVYWALSRWLPWHELLAFMESLLGDGERLQPRLQQWSAAFAPLQRLQPCARCNGLNPALLMVAVCQDHHALRAGFTIEEIFNLTKIDRWFLVQIKEIVDFGEQLAGRRIDRVHSAT